MRQGQVQLYGLERNISYWKGVKSAKYTSRENHTSKRRNVKMQFKLHPQNGATIYLYVHRTSTSMVLQGSTILICMRMSRRFFLRTPPDNSSMVYTCVRDTYSTVSQGFGKSTNFMEHQIWIQSIGHTQVRLYWLPYEHK